MLDGACGAEFGVGNEGACKLIKTLAKLYKLIRI